MVHSAHLTVWTARSWQNHAHDQKKEKQQTYPICTTSWQIHSKLYFNKLLQWQLLYLVLGHYVWSCNCNMKLCSHDYTHCLCIDGYKLHSMIISGLFDGIIIKVLHFASQQHTKSEVRVCLSQSFLPILDSPQLIANEGAGCDLNFYSCSFDLCDWNLEILGNILWQESLWSSRWAAICPLTLTLKVVSSMKVVSRANHFSLKG